ncbi:MAG: hypothetical protein Kow0088_25450 [Anaerolineales bacterium]
MSNLNLVIQITILGMFLIFTAMVLLWTVLSLMVFVLAKINSSPSEKKESFEELDEEFLRQQAVAVAVSTALHQRISSTQGRFPLPPTAIVSAWQAVLRSNILNKRGVSR